MSFDLMVLMNQTNHDSQQRWGKKLKDKGIDCQFPKEFSVNHVLDDDYEPIEISIQYRFTPPLVNKISQTKTFQLHLEPWPLDNDSKTEMLESIDDKSLQQKISAMMFEIQITIAAGRDDHTLILQCLAAATLADICNGVLVDPQEFGAVDKAQIYQVAKHHYQDAIRNLEQQNQKNEIRPKNSSTIYSQKQTTGLFTQLIRVFIPNYKRNELFSPFALSVRSEWKKALTLGYGKFTKRDTINEMGAKKYKKTIEKQKNEPFTFVYGPAAFKYGLLLRMMNKHLKYSEYYFGACMELGKKIYHNIQTQKNCDNNPQAISTNQAGRRLETFLAWACAINISEPALPDKKKLLEGIMHYDEAFSSLKSNKGYLGAEEITIVFLVMAILADEYEIVEKHLERCKKDKEVKKHRALLSKISEHLKNNPEQIISDENLEKDFFDLFNGYRLPSNHLIHDFIGEDYILTEPFGNYIFSWLYLKLFKGQTETTWQEMRRIMMW